MHQVAQANLRDQVGETVRKVLAHYIQPAIERTPLARDAYANAISTVINGGQWQAAKLASAYIGSLAEPVRSLDLEAALADRLTTPESGNAVVGLLKLWHDLDEGLDPDEALAQAGDLAAGLAETSLQGASRDALDEATRAADREPRWALLAADGACEWCQFLADTGARYLAAESVPVPHSPGGPHPGGVCNCSPMPDFGEVEEGGDWWANIPEDEVSQRELRYLDWAEKTYGDKFTVEGYSNAVGWHVRDLDRVPRELQERVAEYLKANDAPFTSGIYLGNGSVPELDHLEHLADRQPRGWPEGSTWREVSGAYSPNFRAMVAGSGSSGSTSLALHEYGHLVDDVLGPSSGTTLSGMMGEWGDVYRRVLATAREADVTIRPYYTQPGLAGPSEMFAEAFANYHLLAGDAGLARLAGTREGGAMLSGYFDSLLSSYR
jgi:hypothetical protein